MYNGGQGLVWTPEASVAVLKAKNAQYTDALNAITELDTNMKNLNKDYLSVDDALKSKVSIMLPSEIDPIKLRNEIISIGDKNGVAVTGLGVMANCFGSDFKELGCYRISFNLHSHYSNFKTLIEAMEKSMRLFMVDSVTIRRQDKKESSSKDPLSDNDPEMLDFAVSFRTYYLK
jgi:hypothetical protein